MAVPAGKSYARVTTGAKIMSVSDEGYIDGYINGGYAIFVRASDGAIELIPIDKLVVTNI